MGFPLSEVAAVVGGRLIGDPAQQVSGISDLKSARSGQICVVWEHNLSAELGASPATCLVVSPELETAVEGKNLILVADPRRALITLLELFHPPRKAPRQIEEGAVVSADASCADDVYIAAGARVEAGGEIHQGAEIHANSYIGEGVVIGEQSVVHPNVTLYPGTRVGSRVVIHSGAVIGSDGFGYLPTRDRRLRKIPQAGVVVIEDDVEIGAGTTIDRATLGQTVIGRGTKIDNQVQIAHNCEVGSDCCLVAQAGVAGTTRIGDGAMIGGQAGISDHVTIGAGVRLAAKSGTQDDLPSGDWIGLPALPAHKARRVLALVQRLPEIYDELRSLRRRCAALEEELGRADTSDG